MPSLKDFKTRIQSLNYTSKITKAMYVMASVRFKKSLPFLNRCKDIYLHSDKILSSLLNQENASLIGGDNPENIIVVFTADKGLCGSFNKKILKDLDSYIKNNEKYKIICIGSKAISHVRKKYPDFIDENLSTQSKDFNSDNITEILSEIALHHKVRSIKTIYGKFISTSINNPDYVNIVPYEKTEENYSNFILEPYNKSESLDMVVRFYIKSVLDFCHQSSINSELSSRMISMDSATKNAKDLSSKLTIKANKLRQSIITNELIDIVSSSRVNE
jgi:F-type H+-transporting ATPase subunit gamma